MIPEDAINSDYLPEEGCPVVGQEMISRDSRPISTSVTMNGSVAYMSLRYYTLEAISLTGADNRLIHRGKIRMVYKSLYNMVKKALCC